MEAPRCIGCFAILAVLLASAAPASARNFVNWQCGEIYVTVYSTAGHKVGLDHHTYEVEISALRDPPKGAPLEVHFRWMPNYSDRVLNQKEAAQWGYYTGPGLDGAYLSNGRAYLNGKRCREIPDG